MHHIYRVDHEPSDAHYWRVRVQRQGRVYRRTFNDQRYGGRELALHAAQAYRDMLIQSLPATGHFSARVRINNRSGISGVRRVDRVEVYLGRSQRQIYWAATWPRGDGRTEHRKFFVTKYGEVGAYQRALDARVTALQARSTEHALKCRTEGQMSEAIYTLHVGSQTYTGTAKELEAIRATMKQEARAEWEKWGKVNTDSLQEPDPSPFKKSA